MSETPTLGRSSEERFPAAVITVHAQAVLVALGVPIDLAGITADSLTTANLLGHDSHGVIRLLPYAEWIANGQINPEARPTVGSTQGAVATVDGRWGLGQPAARLATETVIRLARDHGIAAASITNCNHIGRLGEYVETMADAGCIGWAMCNSGPIVAPAGGRRRTFGTNPLAWAAPMVDGLSLVLDFATAAVAEGKVRLSLALGESVVPGALIDSAGLPTVAAADLYDGGALLPFGGHKGSGLALMIELIGGLLSGMGTAPMPDYGGGNGTVLVSLDIAAFTDPHDFQRRAAEFAARVKQAPDGSVETDVYLPGEVEQCTKAERQIHGIPVPDAVRRDITALAARCRVNLGNFALA